MAKIVKELDAQTKSRQTKLSKKTTSELIDIILRKDKTEKNYASQIQNFKAEINRLSNRVNNFDADMQGTNDALSDATVKLKEANKKIESLESSNKSLRLNVNSTKEELDRALNLLVDKDARIREGKTKYAITCVVFVIVVILCLFL